MSEPNYWGHIPADVRYSDIPPNAKLLYCELTALTNQKGYAWASNAYFAKLYNVHPHTVSEWVKALQKAGFIRVEIDPLKGNERRVWTVQRRTPYSGKDVDLSVKSGRGSTRKDVEEYKKGISEENKETAEPKTVSPKKEKKSRKEEVKATKEEVEAFTLTLGLTTKDGEFMFYNFEEKGWGKNWKMAVQKWKAAGWLPSQKEAARLQQPSLPSTGEPKKTYSAADHIKAMGLEDW